MGFTLCGNFVNSSHCHSSKYHANTIENVITDKNVRTLNLEKKRASSISLQFSLLTF